MNTHLFYILVGIGIATGWLLYLFFFSKEDEIDEISYDLRNLKDSELIPKVKRLIDDSARMEMIREGHAQFMK